MKRPSSADAPPQADADTLRKLSECGTRTGLHQALQHLSVAGWLKPRVADELTTGTRRKLTEAVTNHGTTDTPYGTVLQSMKLPLAKLPRWSYVHPIALLYHLAMISAAFADMMESCVTPGAPVRVVIYIDEICPGNPLRPEKSRTLQAIYWCLADWPQWVLQRTAAWPCFGTIRSSLVKVLPGSIPYLMKRVLLTFFPECGDSFARGVTIHVRNQVLVVTGVFAGFIADEKAHKEMASTKGASGSKPCSSCSNVFGRTAETSLMFGAVTIACADPSLFSRTTNELIYEMYDYIDASSPGDRVALEQQFGLKYEPLGLLGDAYIRTFYKPVDHQLRDWQHTVVGGGVANVECARAIGALNGHGVTIDTLCDWLEQFTLPKQYGKVDRQWISKKRLGKNSLCLQSYAGVMLTIVPIIATFMTETIGAGHALHDHMRCMWLLHLIIGVLRLGPSMAMLYTDRLRDLIREHAELFTRLYPDSVRPKFHHLFHIVDNMLFLGALLSCFVCERKHRFTKRAALWVFRSIDNTVVKEMLSRQCEAIRHGSESLFSRKFLHAPKALTFAGTTMHRATTACLHCGSVSARDLVWVQSGATAIVGTVLAFWNCPPSTSISVQLRMYQRVDAHGTRWDASVESVAFLDSDDVIDTMAYADLGGNTLLVIPPVSVLLSSH
jgi:hypothetical protein